VIQKEPHTAVVSDNLDPETRGRIQVRSLSLLGSDDVVLHIWIEPCFDWGWFYVPDIGEQVEIEVVSGSDKDEIPGQAFLEAPDFRWRGKRFYSTSQPVPSDFKVNYGKRRGFATPGGHIFIFDDTPGLETITLTWKNALGQLQRIELKDGEVLLGTSPTLGVARDTDAVDAAGVGPPPADMVLWMTQVAAALNALVPLSVNPPFPANFGVISGASTKVKAE